MQQQQHNIEHLDSEILAISPIQQSNELLILTKTGTLYSFDLDQQILKEVFRITLPTLNNGKDHYYKQPYYELHTSSNGLYSAIVVNYGQFGQVICNRTGKALLHLDTQNYHEDTVPFSIAFTQFENDDIIIYRSDWNKLETFNLTTTSSTTHRNIAPYENERPEHYLDYFHGALYISPNGQHILDDGWVWHPLSMPHVWSLKNWLSNNSFESEDGASLKKYFRDNWDYPACWIDNDSFAFWHIELWDEEEFDIQPIQNSLGIHIFSIINDENITWEMPEQTQEVFNLFVDQNLFIVVGNENISFYHFSERILSNQIKNSLPQKQHKVRQSLLSFENKTVYEVNYL